MLAAIPPTSASPPIPRHPGGQTSALGWFGVFLALAIAWTWPLAAHFGSRIPHDPGDSVLNIWLLWWNAHSVPFTDAWWSPPIFFPMRGALALSEHLAGLAVLTTPLQWLGASALAAYNAAFILSFALSGFFLFLLLRRLLAAPEHDAVRDIAALCGGLVYGFGPYRAGQLAHLQVLTSQWMPLVLLAMHGFADDGRRRWLALFAIAWLIQSLSNGYYLLFFPVLIALWLAWFADWRRGGSRGAALLGAWVAASVPLVPVLLTYTDVQRHLGLARTPGEMFNFSARPDAFLHASGLLQFWPTTPTATTEEFLFPGITSIALVACAAVAAIRRRPHETAARSPFVFYACAALLMWALAFGPAPPGSGVAGRLRPYTALTWLPGFGALRVPARFAMLATLCLAVASGLAYARVAPLSRARRMGLAAIVIAGLFIDGWMRPMPLVTPPGRVVLPDIPGALVVELPLNEGAVDTAAMYRAMTHRLPLVNGYSGHTPPHYAILSLALRRGDPSVMTELARGRPLVILVNPAYDPDGHIRRLVEGLAGIEARGGSNAGMIYVLPANAAARVAPSSDPWPVRSRGVRRFEVELDLGVVRTVRTVGFPLRWHYGELDARIQVQGSEDGTTWFTVWESWTGGPSLAAAFVNPLEAPVRLTVPDVRMRYVRVYPAAPWLQREVNVYGPQ
jgi:hypothetical protein